jgi:hypothetical protein
MAQRYQGDAPPRRMLVKLLGEILKTQLHERYKWDRGAAKSSQYFGAP